MAGRYLKTLLVFLLMATQAVAASQDLAPDSAKIAAVAAGRIRTAYAHWWGFNEKDATSQLQSALDCRADTIIITNVGNPWLVTPLVMRVSNRVVILESSTVIQAKPGAFRGTEEVLWTFKSLRNITIIGYGATIRMRKDDYQKPPYTSSGSRHAMQFRGCTDCKVIGLRVVSSGGDAIYVSDGWESPQTYCENMLIQSCVLDSSHRQGISVVSARRLTIDNCICSNTRGADPQAGIDIEPGWYRDDIIDVTVSNCEFFNNKLGLVVGLNAGKLRNPISITLRNNYAHDNSHASIEFYGPFTAVTGLGTATLIGNTCHPPMLFYPSPHLALQIITVTAPTIVLPLEGATDLPPTVGVHWRLFPKAEGYHFQLAENPSFLNPLVNDSTITDTLTYVGPLELNTEYYCRVRAKDSASWSAYSSPLSFGPINPTKTESRVIDASKPNNFRLGQNYPNPFNPATSIPIELPVASHVRLTIYSITGDTVTELIDREMLAGYHNVQFDGQTLSTGVYLCRLQAGRYVETRKLLLLK